MRRPQKRYLIKARWKGETVWSEYLSGFKSEVAIMKHFADHLLERSGNYQFQLLEVTRQSAGITASSRVLGVFDKRKFRKRHAKQLRNIKGAA